MNNSTMENINIVMMFNNIYAIPSGPAIYSMLANANKKYQYDLYIMHNNITSDNQKKIMEVVSNFPNAALKFIPMDGVFSEYNKKLHHPIEILYKLCLPSQFPQLDKIIVTDVDVVFEGDISKEYVSFTSDEYFAGVKQTQLDFHPPFSLDITDKNYHFIVGAGYMIYNLKAMRKDDIEQKSLKFLKDNIQYLYAEEQEVLSQVCYPKIKLLHPKNMVLTPWYVLDNFLFEFPYTSTKEEHEEAKNDPVQVHYVLDKNKPWLNPYAPKAELWYRYLSYTPFFADHFKNDLNVTESRMRQFKKMKKRQRKRTLFLSIWSARWKRFFGG